jgi:tetratricopeptide (TPR) repeat protein
MYGFRWERQEWNNCGPTNITIALSHFGWQENQNYAQQFLRPNDEDKNVSPIELVNFVNTQTGVRAITRMGGDTVMLKTLIANNFPVVVETTFTPEGSDWLGHYQTVVGYDDTSRNFFVYDSYLGTGSNNNGVPEPYDQFDRDWQAFNRVFIVLYEQSRESELISLLGDRADVEAAAEMALEVARREAQADPTSPFPWFNMGTSLVRLGEYEQAAAAFDAATQRELPFRMLWYQFGPFEAYYNVGRYDDVMGLVRNNLTNAGGFIEETYYWEGRVHAARGDVNAAAASFQRALNSNPMFTQAQEALEQL